MAAPRPSSDADLIRSLAPSQLLADKGADLVVINPGSANLRIGLASEAAPRQIPHLIAWFSPALAEKAGTAEPRPKGALGEFSRGSTRWQASEATVLAREQCCQQIQQALGVARGSDSAVSQKGSEPVLQDECFQWTELRQLAPSKPWAAASSRAGGKDSVEETHLAEGPGGAGSEVEPSDAGRATPVAGSDQERVEESPAAKRQRTEGQGTTEEAAMGRDPEGSMPVTEEAPLAGEGHVKGGEGGELTRPSGEEGGRGGASEAPASEAAEAMQEEAGQVATYKKFVCGEEAERVPAGEPYVLHRPIRRGHFNVSSEYSLQQVVDDLTTIWAWALDFQVAAHDRSQLSAVLVVPETFSSRELKEVVDVVLRRLHLRSVVLHQEAVAATLGNAISTACVINLGAQVCSVSCIEDGALVAASQVALPYGGQDVSRCIEWLLRGAEHWPYDACDPTEDAQDQVLLDQLKVAICRFTDGVTDGEASIHVRTHGGPSQSFPIDPSPAARVAPMGLFFPALLLGPSYAGFPDSRYFVDHEDTLEDLFLTESGRRPDDSEDVLPFGRQSHRRPPPGGSSSEALEGLHQAVVKSILALERSDTHGKMFSSILLVGGGAQIPGLVDTLEDRVLGTIPEHASVNSVEVLPNRTAGAIVAWKGGAVMGVLDTARDAWLQRDDWLPGGARVGSARSYRDSVNIQTQLYWYSASLE